MPRAAPYVVWLLALWIGWTIFMGLSPRKDMGLDSACLFTCLFDNGLENVCLFDVKCRGYDDDYAAKVIGQMDRQAYIRWHFPLDTFYPLIYGATFAALLLWLATLNGFSPAYRGLVSIVPVLAAFSDLIENSLVLSMVVSEQTKLVETASIFTQVKCLSLVVSFVLLIGLGARAALLHWLLPSRTR